MLTMDYRILRQFGNKVKKLRKNRGWSQEELAKRAGLHRTYIGSIERSERNVSLLNIDRIARALNIQAKDLLK
jgi:transcriptional regulator with XRE-family HTH domain